MANLSMTSNWGTTILSLLSCRSLLTRWLLALLVTALAATLVAPMGPARADGDSSSSGEADPASPALTTPFQLVEGRDVDDRLPQPEDRYALAGGCYVIEAPGEGFVARDGDGELRLTDAAGDAAPLHFQATRLGQYLLATNEGPDTSVEGAWWDERDYVAAARVLPQLSLSDLGIGLPMIHRPPLRSAPLPVLTTDEVTVADEPSGAADWEIAAAGEDPDARVPDTHPGQGQPPTDRPGQGADRRGDDHPGQGHGPPGGEEWQTYMLSLPETGQALAVEAGELRLVDADAGDEFAFHLVDEDVDGPHPDDCATWPEVETNTTGAPEPASDNPAAPVEGFFESHVHGMAFEFLGGEARCGRPWHPYGVEYAIGDCFEDGNAYNSVLEVAVAGRDPQEPVTDYDPVGWPTFAYWPEHDVLSHEQYYWRWLERAYHGGLRLSVNLLVENAALCELLPDKRNSCNEMDAIRLQAQRLFELQDYIDAQSGGPGQGWFRIVTSPAQAREAINAGRLAVVLGIEVSELFDCRTYLDQPQCTEEQIDERLDEVYDMGVRQMQMINKFDNALSGVTGDGGETGVVVNIGNRWRTGHFWDMETCPEDPHDHEHSDSHDHVHSHGHDDDRQYPPGDEHDRRQLNAVDDTPVGEQEETAQLAGIILELVGLTDGYAAPVYPEGPHCNTRGLSDLGIHLLEKMIDKGMIFDPDHMSAAGQRQALDHIQHEIIPAEREAAEAENRAPVQPAVFSSHSWANDVTYQRIYQLDGVVAPRTASADGFVHRWISHRDWAEQWVQDEDYLFGLGFGADTNGLGAQPGPRSSPEQPVDYGQGWEAPVGGVTIEQHTSGVRTYDITDDGVAHYGLFADWLHELTLAADELAPDRGGGKAIMEDMLAGPEAYLQMWERFVYPGNDCVDDQSTLQVDDLHALLGLNLEGFLEAAGQPVTREGAAYVYCVDDGLGGIETVEVVFDADGVAAELRASALLDDALGGGADATGGGVDDGVLGRLIRGR